MQGSAVPSCARGTWGYGDALFIRRDDGEAKKGEEAAAALQPAGHRRDAAGMFALPAERERGSDWTTTTTTTEHL